MKTSPNQAIRELRTIIGQTQGQFAALIGASKDVVASWEIGRSRLSPAFARRIAFATGVDAEALRRARGPLTVQDPLRGRVPFTAEAFQRYRERVWGRSDAAAARQHLKHCADALELILVAAAGSGDSQAPSQLPAVLVSFAQWCDQTREDFQLGAPIDAQLDQRKRTDTFNRTYRQWRAMQKEDPDMCRTLGFKDDPAKRDDEYLRLTLETVPLWRPGHSMRAPAQFDAETAPAR